MGLIIDIFYDSLGIHAFAAVLLVYSRAFLLRLIVPSNGYKADIQPTLGNLGFKSFSILSLILIAIHHAAVFFLDAWDSTLFFTTLPKVALSVLLTYLAVCIIQAVFMLVGRR